MSLDKSKAESTQMRKRNKIAAYYVVASCFFMLGLSYAAVPFYDWFCKTTGYGGTTMAAKTAPEKQGQRKFTVRFDANIAGGLPWQFQAEAASVEVKSGEVREAGYRIKNISNAESTGIASYNVVPEQAGAYFNKLQCFCFTDQTLKTGAQREEQVVFFIDPAIENNPELSGLNTITLSYTFFPAKTPVKPLAAIGQNTLIKTE